MPGPIDARANETFSVVPHCKQAHKAAEAFQPSGPMFKGTVNVQCHVIDNVQHARNNETLWKQGCAVVVFKVLCTTIID